MAETVEVPKALIEALAESDLVTSGGRYAVLAIIALLPPPPPTFTDEEALAFHQGMWPPSTITATNATVRGRSFLTRLYAAGLKVVPVDE